VTLRIAVPAVLKHFLIKKYKLMLQRYKKADETPNDSPTFYIIANE